jgi:hypothetical protein
MVDPNAKIFVMVDGVETGPLAYEQVVKMLWKGELKPETLYTTPGATEWIPLSCLTNATKSTDPIMIPDFFSFLSKIDFRTSKTDVGTVIIMIGVAALAFFAIVFDSSVESGASRVINMGKSQDRLIGVLASMTVVFIGSVFIVCDKLDQKPER